MDTDAPYEIQGIGQVRVQSSHSEKFLKLQHSYTHFNSQNTGLMQNGVYAISVVTRGRTLLHVRYPLQPVIIVRFMTKNDDIFTLYVLTDHVETAVPSITVHVQYT